VPISDQGAIDFLREIVAIYSPSTREAPVAEHIVSRLSRWGYDAEVDQAGNAVGRLGSDPHRLLLLGHIDTVLGQIDTRLEDGQLYGRGSVDAKGPFATMAIAAARAHEASGIGVTVVGAVEEEAATSKGAYHVAETHAPAQFVIIGEPSRWNRITIGYKGRLLVDYRYERDMSHSAGADGTAAETAFRYWSALACLCEEHNHLRSKRFEMLDPSLRAIQSGGDGLRESVEMTIGIRVPLGVELEDLGERLVAMGGDASVRLRGLERPWLSSKRSRLTGAFLTSIRAEGGRAAFVTKTGTSDLNVIGPRWQCPIVAYGPGDSALDHTPNEHLDLTEYLTAIRVLERTLVRLAGQQAN